MTISRNRWLLEKAQRGRERGWKGDRDRRRIGTFIGHNPVHSLGRREIFAERFLSNAEEENA